MARATFPRLLLLLSLVHLPAQGQPNYLEGLRLKSEGRRNLILIVTAELGHEDLGCYGRERARTPNIDRLASEGVRFTHYYAGSSLPIPSRASMLTGADARAVPQHPGDATSPMASHRSLGRLLQSAGYVTGAIGTWGLGHEGSSTTPNRVGFNEWFGYLDPVSASDDAVLWRNDRKFAFTANASGNQQQDPHELLMRAALNFIRVNKRRPFFLYFSPPARPAKASGGGAARPPVGQVEIIAQLDDAVGRLLQVLQETGLDQETFVFFTSDAGPHLSTGNTPASKLESSRLIQGGTSGLREAGIRVPMLVRAPGRIPAGAVNEVVWAAWDLFPTIAELAMTRVEDRPNRISMVPALHGHLQTNLHSHLYWELPGPPRQQAVRMGNWKALRLDPTQTLLLYDLRADPGETENVADRHPDVRARLLSILDAPAPAPAPGSTAEPHAAGSETAKETSPPPR